MLKENGIHCLKISQIYFTSPWGFESKNEFLNMVLLARTLLSPWELLLTLKKIETKLGRKSVVLKSDFRKKSDLLNNETCKEIIKLFSKD